MKINAVEFIGSFPKVSSCPKDGLPEYAFIGRSNVGKSSLINMLCDRKDIARVSHTPGKTQHLNYYLIEEKWYMVDLPGYGYARISKKMRESWKKMIKGYFLKRETMFCAFVLVDSNIAPQKIDIDFMNWLGENSIPFVIVYTKTDRLKKRELEKNVENIRQEILKTWEELPMEFFTSSRKNIGRDDILGLIADVNEKVAE
ncbi:MAG: YihA family ribosome biogenesis GTP-binding protein [Bacteroidetes bacterium]|nr:MAG: YihA family ribosome biogenesis GTP-binding protein [Bacteroidota bacterium]